MREAVGAALMLGLGLVACSGPLSVEEPGPSLARPPTMERATPTPPELTVRVAAKHATSTPWAYPASLTSTGPGACAATTLDQIAAEIRLRFPAVHDVGNFRPGGPQGVAMSAGPPGVPATTPVPATEKVAYLTGLQDQDRFGLVFFRGSACRGDVCADRQWWYFETDEQCRPRWVGYHNTVEREGGRHGTCVDARGEALWHMPENPLARARCDASWAAQDISGFRRAWSLAPGATCGKRETAVPVDLVIAQSDPTRTRAQLTVDGTGIDFVDGVVWTGTVERQRFTASFDSTVAGDCPIARKVRIDLDYEPPSQYGLPGAFGVIDVEETAIGACATPVPTCTASLHFVPRE